MDLGCMTPRKGEVEFLQEANRERRRKPKAGFMCGINDRLSTNLTARGRRREN